MDDQDDKPLPSLDLAFDWVKGVLYDQSRAADALDTKAATFFSIATLVLGVGISLTISQTDSLPAPALAFSVMAMALYLALVVFAGKGPRREGLRYSGQSRNETGVLLGRGANAVQD